MTASEDNPVYLIVNQIPLGHVMTYGQIAALAPGQTARMVARALKNTPEDTRLPWHRVVSAGLKIAEFPGWQVQEKRLREEGVCFRRERSIDKRHHWMPR